MREWHIAHMEKLLLKHAQGLSPTANSWEKKNHKKYGSLQSICKQIEYDVKHGVLLEDLVAAISKVRNHSSFQGLRENEASMNRLSDIEKHFITPKSITWF